MGEPRSRTRYCGRCLTTFPLDPDVCPNLSCHARRPEEGWGTIWEAGEIIDRHYRVLRRLATGGAGVTYLAREVEPSSAEDDLDLAVKVLWASRDHGSYLRRLSQEAQILQELAHPNIVEYRGFVHRTGSAPYLVTLFEHGGSLYDHVRRRQRLGLRETACIGRQVMEALGRAHQAGVIHRDLKPENVLLAEIPEPGNAPLVRVADFGIAKVQGLFSDGLTRVGAFVGTPQYAAPEQFDGLPPTPATDVFAAGAMLYFCLQGQPLLPLANRLPPDEARELLVQKLPPRLKLPDERPEQVKAVEQALEAAMALEPGERASVLEMHGMLEAIEQGSFLVRPTHTAVPERSRTAETNVFLFSQDGAEDAPTDDGQATVLPAADGAPAPVQAPIAPAPAADDPLPPVPADRFPRPSPGGWEFALQAKPPPAPRDGDRAREAPADTPSPPAQTDRAPPPPRPGRAGRGAGMGMLLAGGLLAVVLCGGGGLGGLVWFRPDLVARIPGLQGMTGPAPTPEEAMRSRVADLIDQGRDACEIRAALRLGLTVTTEGRVIPTEVPGMGAPRKVECLRSFLAGFKLQPAPTSDLRFAIEVAAQSR